MSAFAKATAKTGGKGITLPLVHPVTFLLVGFCLHAFEALEARGLSKALLWLQPMSFALNPALRAPPVEQDSHPLTFSRLASRDLEARGFEPLTSSLQSWRSTN